MAPPAAAISVTSCLYDNRSAPSTGTSTVLARRGAAGKCLRHSAWSQIFGFLFGFFSIRCIQEFRSRASYPVIVRSKEGVHPPSLPCSPLLLSLTAYRLSAPMSVLRLRGFPLFLCSPGATKE